MRELDLGQLRLLFFLFLGATIIVFITLVAYIVVAGRRQRAKEAQARVAEASTPPVSLPPAQQVMALIREESGGRLQVEMDGNRYRRLADAEDPDVRRKIIATAMELIQFTGVLGQEVVEPAPLEKTRTWREDLREGSSTELQRARAASTAQASRLGPPAAPEEVEARFLSLLAELGQTPAPLERPTLVEAIQHRLQPKLPESDQTRTFVDDIDGILQRRVQLVPALAGRDLHVRPGPDGKVRFAFEGKEYESMDDVPNLTARQLIKDAIQEWDETT